MLQNIWAPEGVAARWVGSLLRSCFNFSLSY